MYRYIQVHCTCGRSSSAFWLHRSDFFLSLLFFFPLCLTHCISFPLSFSEMLPCQWALGSDHYSEAQMGCLDTELGDELSHRAGSCSSISSSQDGAVCPVFLSSSPWCLALLCCFLHCSGWLKCLADRPLLKTYPSMASDLWRMRSNTLIQSCLKGNISVWVLSAAARGPAEEKRQRERGEREREKGRTQSSPFFKCFVILCVEWVLCQCSFRWSCIWALLTHLRRRQSQCWRDGVMEGCWRCFQG